MNSNSKRIIKNTAFLYLRMLFLLLITLFTSRIVLNKLGIEDFGIYNVVGGVATMFTFFSSSLANATQRFLNIELGKGEIDKATNVFNQHLILYIIISIIIIILAETIGLWFIYNKLIIPENRKFAAVCIYQFTLISLCITLIGIVFNSAIIAHEDMGVYSYIGIFEGISKLFIAHIISLTSFDKLIIYGFLLLIVTIIVQSFYASYGFHNYKECKLHFIWDKDLLKKTSSILGWNSIGTAVYAINDSGINILLNLFFGPTINAARAVSFQVNSAVNNFATNFFTSVRPQIVKSYAKGDTDYLLTLFYGSSKYSFFLLWIFCLPISISINKLLYLWLKEVPEFASSFTVWILAYSLINVLNTPIWSIALATGNLKKYISIGSSVFLMIFPVSYLALKFNCSPVSVFIIAFLIRLLYIIVVLRIIKKYVPFSMTNYWSQVCQPILKVIPISFICTILIYHYIPHTILGLFIFSILTIFIIIACIWLGGLDKHEKIFICNIIKTRLKG